MKAIQVQFSNTNKKLPKHKQCAPVVILLWCFMGHLFLWKSAWPWAEAWVVRGLDLFNDIFLLICSLCYFYLLNECMLVVLLGLYCGESEWVCVTVVSDNKILHDMDDVLQSTTFKLWGYAFPPFFFFFYSSCLYFTCIDIVYLTRIPFTGVLACSRNPSWSMVFGTHNGYNA